MVQRKQSYGASKPTAKKLRAASPADNDYEDAAGGFEDMEGGYEDMDGGFKDLEGTDGQEDNQDSEGDEHMDDGDDSEDGADPSLLGKLDASTAGMSSSDAAKRQTDLYAVPTADEVANLRETAELFKSNVLKLEIDELLHEVKPNYTKMGSLEAVLRRLFTLLTSMPSIEPAPLAKALKAAEKSIPGFKNIKVPFTKPAPQPTDDSASLPFGFAPPSGVHLVGSWPRKAATRPSPGAPPTNVDVAMVMPSSLFTERDALDGRYGHKRAYYLAVVAAAIMQAARGEEALPVHPVWEASAGDPRRPILVLHPVPNGSNLDFSKTKTVIRLHPAHDPAMFKWTNRLGPLRSGLRHKDEEGPTPSYNSSVLLDGLALAHLVYLHKTAQAAPAFADACALLGIWARQRGWGAVGTGASKAPGLALAGSQPGGFLLSMVLAHLLHGEAGHSRLAGGLSSYQMFRATMDWLAGPGFTPGQVHLISSIHGVPTLAQHSTAEWSQAFPVPYGLGEIGPAVLVDPTGSVNLLASTPRGSIDALAVEAARTRALLTDSNDAFRDVFLTRLPPVLAFDDVFRLPIPAGHKTQDAPNHVLAAAAEVGDTLRAALGARAASVSVFVRRSKEVELDTPPPGPKGSSLLIGVHYHGSQVRSLVDHGPPQADTTLAQAYKSFWGDKAELRRFRDGITRLAIVWSVPPQGRWAIPHEIIRTVLINHHGLDPDTVECVTGGVMAVLEPDVKLARAAHAHASGKVPTIAEAEHELSNALRRIELPLSIARIAGSDAGLRGTDPAAPFPLDVLGLGTDVPAPASYLAAHTLMIEFERSPRWPRDRDALWAMQAALLERIASALPDEVPETRASVAFPHPTLSGTTGAPVLDVVLITGYAFRIRIRLDVEADVLEDMVADSDLPASLRAEAKSMHGALARETEYSPRLHQALTQVGHRFPAFADATRQAVRWVNAQLATPFVPTILVELLMARVFLRQSDSATTRSSTRSGPAGAAPPSSPAAGWIAFLRLLAEWRTTEEPILVPVFSVGEEDKEKLANSEGIEPTTIQPASGFPPALRQRALDAFGTRSRNGAWVVATEEDPEGLWFTPTSSDTSAFASAAQGLRTLAKQSVKLLSDASAAQTALSQHTLFHAPLERYDFVLHLNPAVCVRHYQSVSLLPEARDAHRLAAAQETLGSDPKPGFDPAESYVSLLRSRYGDAVRLFHDTQGGAIVAGLWNPALRTPRRFKAAAAANVAPAEVEKADEGRLAQGKNVALNAQAIVAEMARLGHGIVERVELRST